MCKHQEEIEELKREKLRLENSKLRRDRVQSWFNGLFKLVLVGCAITFLSFK